jgi:1,2-diacylglycerol 3-alpha-glucosyltransferase
MAHRYGRCPIVYTNHTRYDLYTGAYTALPQPTADAIMRQIWPDFTDYCDVVITPSASVRDVMRDFGVRQPIRVIPNGIHLAPFTQPQAPRSRASLGVPEDTILTAYTGRLASGEEPEPAAGAVCAGNGDRARPAPPADRQRAGGGRS